MRYGQALRDRDSTKMIPEGVSILYEKDEIEALLHLFDFIDDFNAEQAEAIVPVFTMRDESGHHVRLEQDDLLAKVDSPQFAPETFAVKVFFFDEMRPLFDAYIALLKEQNEETERAIEEGDADEDDGNPFAFLYHVFSEIKKKFFPERSEMH